MVNEGTRMTMTKADIVNQVFEKVGLTKKEATDVVEFVFNTVKDILKSGEKVKVSGFGSFVVRKKRPRVGRNPKTGEEMTITARKVLTFKPSPVLRAMLNRDFAKAAQLAAHEDDDEDGDDSKVYAR